MTQIRNRSNLVWDRAYFTINRGSVRKMLPAYKIFTTSLNSLLQVQSKPGMVTHIQSFFNPSNSLVQTNQPLIHFREFSAILAACAISSSSYLASSVSWRDIIAMTIGSLFGGQTTAISFLVP